MSAHDSDWEGVRLHVVSGKGGTGKTTVAAALALALASGGRNVLLVEVEGRQGIARLFDCPPLPYEERRVASAPDGGHVYALAIDPREALVDYLEMFYNLASAGKALTRFGVVDFVTTVAPGLRDVLLSGKATEAARRKTRDGRHAYDAVVMDAPPTGRLTRFLNVNSEVAGLAKVGPIRSHADKVMSVISSPETAVHFVSLLEEMPVQETLDGIAELRTAGLPVGGIIINMMRAPMLPKRALDAAARGDADMVDMAAGLKAAGVDDAGAAEGLAAELAAHAAQVARERGERRRLAAANRPRYRLPMLGNGIDLAGLYELAEDLRRQGAA